ncbi:MAG: PAS domain S-box protein [Nitrospira sp. BO4]|nr:PAS domain S-box protein [Nitrospira sp. BO4]
MNRPNNTNEFEPHDDSVLRESQRRYRTLFDMAPIAVYSCDASGIIREYNNRAAELWGRKPAPDDSDERFCGSFKLYRPDGSFMPHKQCPMGDVLCGNVPQIHDAEVHIERPDGSRVIVIVNITPLTNKQGHITGAINCFYDITERKQTEQTLRASEARYRHLYESIDEGCCVIQVVLDANNMAVDYKFLEANPAFEKQTGITHAPGKSLRAVAFYHEDHWFEMFGQVALTGEARRFEFPTADLQRWYEGYAYPFGEARGRKVGILFNDITERKRTEAQLRQLNNNLEAQVTERTEELAATQTRLRGLAAELTDTEQRERKRLAADLHDELAQLLALTRMKLTLAKRQAMPPPLAKIITDVDGFTDKALTYTRTLISQLSPPALAVSGLPVALQWLTDQMQQHNLAVSIQVKTPIPTIPEDQALLLFQSIRELLFNCIKHAASHEAMLTLDLRDGSLYAQVCDHGVGFDPLCATKTANAPARGFGLCSIRERMLSLGGHFELRSSPGNGTTATLVLPLCESHGIPSSLTASHGSITNNGASGR